MSTENPTPPAVLSHLRAAAIFFQLDPLLELVSVCIPGYGEVALRRCDAEQLEPPNEVRPEARQAMLAEAKRERERPQ